MINEEYLEKYRESLKSAWGCNDYSDWPVKVNTVMHTFLKPYAEEFLDDLEALHKNGIDKNTIAREFQNPARLYRIIDPVIFGMKRMRLELDLQRQVVVDILEMVKCLKAGSVFNEDGKNIVLSRTEIDYTNKALKFKKPTKDESKIIQRFCGGIWAYTEAIFFRAHDVTKEVHGLYSLENSSSNLLVREYLHLKPESIWPDVPFIPYKKIVVYTKYNDTLKIKINSYNHLFLNAGNYIEALEEYAVLADGRQIDIDELNNIIDIMMKSVETIYKWTSNATWHEIVNRYADIYWYRKSPLRKLRNIDWKVPQTVREQINVSSPNEARMQNLSTEMVQRMTRIVI